MDEVANHLEISTSNLFKIIKKESFEVSYLLKAAELFKLPLSYFFNDPTLFSTSQNIQTGDFNQAGVNNTQKVKGGKAPSADLATELDQCHRDNESLKRELALANALVASKDETITLLRASYTRPN